MVTRPSVLLGMYQRLDKLRKNAFASVALFGADEDSTISGIWVFRGHELAFTVSIKRFHTLIVGMRYFQKTGFGQFYVY